MNEGWRSVPLLVLLAFFTGCGTIGDALNAPIAQSLLSPGPHVMGGVRSEVALLSGDRSGCKGMGDFVFVIDLPFSFSLDLVFLPFTIPYTLLRADPSPPAVGNSGRD